MDEEEWRQRFRFITGSQAAADRLIRLITAYGARSTWKWEEIAESTEHDLLRGKSVEEVIRWFANLV
jgi:hypothetical protein